MMEPTTQDLVAALADEFDAYMRPAWGKDYDFERDVARVDAIDCFHLYHLAMSIVPRHWYTQELRAYIERLAGGIQ